MTLKKGNFLVPESLLNCFFVIYFFAFSVLTDVLLVGTGYYRESFKLYYVGGGPSDRRSSHNLLSSSDWILDVFLSWFPLA